MKHIGNYKENRKEHWENDRKANANRMEAIENMRELQENHKQQEHVGK